MVTVIRGEKMRKEYTISLQRHRAAIVIQKQIKGRISKTKFTNVYDASIVIQSGTKLFHFYGWSDVTLFLFVGCLILSSKRIIMGSTWVDCALG